MLAPPAHSSAHQYKMLNALRGIVALFIVTFHFPPIFFGAELPLVRHLYVFTNMFFTLSGFILMAAYGHKLERLTDLGTFFKKRILRLYPLHLFAMGLILLAPYMAYATKEGLHFLLGLPVNGLPSFPVYAKELIGDFFLLQGLGVFDSLHLNFPAWSLSVEFYTSLLFGLLLVLTKKSRAVVFGTFAILGFVVVANSPHFMGVTYDLGLFRCFASFFIGALMFQLRPRLVRSHIMDAWSVPLQTAILLLTISFTTIVNVDSALSLAAPLLFGLFVLLMSFDKGDYADALCTRIPLWLGQRSYAIFLTHASWLFIGWVTKDIMEELRLDKLMSLTIGTIAFGVFITLMLTVANLAHLHIEKRFIAKK